MDLRTDLATERREIAGSGNIDGIVCREYTDMGVGVTEITVTNENGEKSIGKPRGKYITLDVTPFRVGTDVISPELSVLSARIGRLLPNGDAPVLVAGLGNSDITSDALGPKTASMILATRHIGGELRESMGLKNLRSVAVSVPGVLGKTGIESGEVLKNIIAAVRPCALITVDALAARRLERLGTTVQLSDSGIVPGSGVGNSRCKIDRETMGVPVISVGVPTVVDGRTLAADIMDEAGLFDESIRDRVLGGLAAEITVAPKEIDIMTERASRLIAMGINCALQKSLGAEEILSLVCG